MLRGDNRMSPGAMGGSTNIVDAKKIIKSTTVGDKGLLDPNMAGYATMKEADWMAWGRGGG